MDDEAARGRAALAGGADGAEHDRAHRQIEPRVRGHDDGVVAAELEKRAAEPSRDGLRDAAADAVEPVNEISGRRWSFSICSPTMLPGPMTRLKTPDSRDRP